MRGMRGQSTTGDTGWAAGNGEVVRIGGARPERASGAPRAPEGFCLDCHTVAEPAERPLKFGQGGRLLMIFTLTAAFLSVVVGAMFWPILFVLVCAVIGYSIWLGMQARQRCPKCGSRNLIPSDAPRARAEMRGDADRGT